MENEDADLTNFLSIILEEHGKIALNYHSIIHAKLTKCGKYIIITRHRYSFQTEKLFINHIYYVDNEQICNNLIKILYHTPPEYSGICKNMAELYYKESN